jgi:hypothetical protein
MDEKYGIVATPVLHLMKKSIRRMFVLLIIFVVLLVFSVIDSIYQRCRIIRLLESFEVVEEVTETYDVTQDGEDNNNNFITGDNNEVNNGTKD